MPHRTYSRDELLGYRSLVTRLPEGLLREENSDLLVDEATTPHAPGAATVGYDAPRNHFPAPSLADGAVALPHEASPATRGPPPGAHPPPPPGFGAARPPGFAAASPHAPGTLGAFPPPGLGPPGGAFPPPGLDPPDSASPPPGLSGSAGTFPLSGPGVPAGTFPPSGLGTPDGAPPPPGLGALGGAFLPPGLPSILSVPPLGPPGKARPDASTDTVSPQRGAPRAEASGGSDGTGRSGGPVATSASVQAAPSPASRREGAPAKKEGTGGGNKDAKRILTVPPGARGFPPDRARPLPDGKGGWISAPRAPERAPPTPIRSRLVDGGEVGTKTSERRERGGDRRRDTNLGVSPPGPQGLGNYGQRPGGDPAGAGYKATKSATGAGNEAGDWRVRRTAGTGPGISGQGPPGPAAGALPPPTSHPVHLTPSPPGLPPLAAGEAPGAGPVRARTTAPPPPPPGFAAPSAVVEATALASLLPPHAPSVPQPSAPPQVGGTPPLGRVPQPPRPPQATTDMMFQSMVSTFTAEDFEAERQRHRAQRKAGGSAAPPRSTEDDLFAELAGAQTSEVGPANGPRASGGSGGVDEPREPHQPQAPRAWGEVVRGAAEGGDPTPAVPAANAAGAAEAMAKGGYRQATATATAKDRPPSAPKRALAEPAARRRGVAVQPGVERATPEAAKGRDGGDAGGGKTAAGRGQVGRDPKPAPGDRGAERAGPRGSRERGLERAGPAPGAPLSAEEFEAERQQARDAWKREAEAKRGASTAGDGSDVVDVVGDDEFERWRLESMGLNNGGGGGKREGKGKGRGAGYGGATAPGVANAEAALGVPSSGSSSSRLAAFFAASGLEDDETPPPPRAGAEAPDAAPLRRDPRPDGALARAAAGRQPDEGAEAPAATGQKLLALLQKQRAAQGAGQPLPPPPPPARARPAPQVDPPAAPLAADPAQADRLRQLLVDSVQGGRGRPAAAHPPSLAPDLAPDASALAQQRDELAEALRIRQAMAQRSRAMAAGHGGPDGPPPLPPGADAGPHHGYGPPGLLQQLPHLLQDRPAALGVPLGLSDAPYGGAGGRPSGPYRYDQGPPAALRGQVAADGFPGDPSYAPLGGAPPPPPRGAYDGPHGGPREGPLPAYGGYLAASQPGYPAPMQQRELRAAYPDGPPLPPPPPPPHAAAGTYGRGDAGPHGRQRDGGTRGDAFPPQLAGRGLASVYDAPPGMYPQMGHPAAYGPQPGGGYPTMPGYPVQPLYGHRPGPGLQPDLLSLLQSSGAAAGSVAGATAQLSGQRAAADLLGRLQAAQRQAGGGQ